MMLIILIVLILLFFGGGFAGWGGSYGRYGGISLGTVLILVLLFLLVTNRL